MSTIPYTFTRGTYSLLLYSTLNSFTVTAQLEEDDDEDDSWSLILALVVVIVFLALLSICLIVVICEIRTSKPDPAPAPKLPEVKLVHIGVQTEPEEPSIAIVARMPSSTESEEMLPSPAPFSKILDGLYHLSPNAVYGRNATLIKGEAVAVPREVFLKVFDHSNLCMYEYEFYTSILNQEGPSLMYNQARTFIPELIDAGQLTMGNRTHPTLVLERGNFTIRDFILPKKSSQQYVVLSEKSTFFQICSSVRFVHSKGYVHGDLHPGSIMFFGSRWKLIDFSSWGNEEIPMVCRSTPHYTAPEIMQAIAKGAASMPMAQQADVWSLGLIGWEILTKQSLLPTSEYTEEDIVEMSFGNEPYPWEGKSAQFWKPIKSPAAAKIVQNCLQRDPERRWNVEKVIQHMKFWS